MTVSTGSGYFTIGMKFRTIILGLIIAAAAAAAVLFYFRKPLAMFFQRVPAASAAGGRQSLETALRERLNELEINAKTITIRQSDSITTLQTSLPRGKPLEWLVWYLGQAQQGTPYKLSDCVYTAKTESGFLLFTSARADRKPFKVSFKLASRFLSSSARIALIIEMSSPDAYNRLMDFCVLPDPVTFAFIPGDSQSTGAAGIVLARHKESIMYLPLEAHTKVPSTYADYLVLVHYSQERIHDIVSSAAKQVPGFSGIMNLYGSRACEDSRIMNILLSETKKHRAYFVDSRTTTRSVCLPLARKASVPCIAIDERIGALPEAALEARLHACTVKAQKTGQLTVLCSGTTALAAVLAKSSTYFKHNGVSPVFVSALLQPAKKR